MDERLLAVAYDFAVRDIPSRLLRDLYNTEPRLAVRFSREEWREIMDEVINLRVDESPIPEVGSEVSFTLSGDQTNHGYVDRIFRQWGETYVWISTENDGPYTVPIEDCWVL